MDKNTLIHNVVKQVEWDFILHILSEMKYTLKDKKLTKKQLVDDLIMHLEATLNDKKNKLVTDIWTINCEYDDNTDYIFVEVLFTPIVIWADTEKKKHYTNDKIKRLEQRLELAVLSEQYEKASKIKKTLDKIKSNNN
jgi:hypothetical protein